MTSVEMGTLTKTSLLSKAKIAILFVVTGPKGSQYGNVFSLNINPFGY